ncbi:ABC transporter ATP-binding protein/permease [Aerococcaceae bacterium NML171108]|nr:ABC transporter ATP-binding protein/permease [Aerococcaceae bacterium NML171108]
MQTLIKNKKNILVLMASIGHSVLTVSASLLFSKCIEELMNKNINGFFSYTFLSIALWLVATLISLLQIYIQTTVIQDFVYELRYRATYDFVNHENLCQNDETQKYLNMCLYDTESITKHSNNLYSILNSTVMAIVASITLVKIHFSLLIYVLIAVTIMSVAPKFFEGKIKERTQALSTAMETFKKELDNLVQGRITLNNFNAFNWLFGSIKEQSLNLKKCHIGNTLSVRQLQGLIVILNIINQLGIIGLAGFLAYVNLISFPMIFSVGQVAGQMFGGITAVISGAPEYYALTTLLNKFPSSNVKVKEGEIVDNSMPLKESIQLNHVVVPYKDKRIEFPNVEFIAGKKYVITGASGSGKSTLLKVLNGDVKSFSGEILWDKVSYNDIKTETLKQSIVTMSQTTHLFNKSIKDNIILEKAYDDVLMQQIIKQTHLDSLITQLEDGLDTVINTDNITLSGGQIQRVSLARCLYHEPNILLIDEGTANIDAATAIDIEKILLTTPRLTVIMVSHHLFDEVAPFIDSIVTI